MSAYNAWGDWIDRGHIGSFSSMTSKISETDDARAEVLASLTKILSDVGGVTPEDISPESRLIDDLAISSLNLIEAIVQVEDAFGVRIEDADVQGFTTVGDVITFIETNRSEASK